MGPELDAIRAQFKHLRFYCFSPKKLQLSFSVLHQSPLLAVQQGCKKVKESSRAEPGRSSRVLSVQDHVPLT